MHYHIIVGGNGVSRDEVEGLWHEGWANADRLQFTERGLTNLVGYLMKSQKYAEKDERCWNCSQNMIRPDEIIDDDKITKRRMKKLIEAARNDESEKYLGCIYKGWCVIYCDVGENLVTGRPYARIKLLRRGAEISNC